MTQSFVNLDSQQSNISLPQSLLPTMSDGDRAVGADSTEHLKTAFDIFNELSLQLADSYQHLEHRVAELTSELDTVSEQRYCELKQKEQLACRLETLINVLPGGVVVLDNTGRIIESNPVAEALLEADLLGKRWCEVMQACFAPQDDDGHEVSNREGKKISIATRSLAGDGQIILLTDQTETRKLQAELSRNERLSALGKMVSTLAHQVRTPLSSAMLYANHLDSPDLALSQRSAFTKKLLNRLHYMERQVRDMLLFVKGDIPLSDKVSARELQSALHEAVEMPLKAYQATCQWEMLATDGQIRCNLDAVIGALLNLVNNSLQSASQPALTIGFYGGDQALTIRILDNGTGLSPVFEKQQDKLFFTTKEQGTGIGLSVVKIVAQSHGGKFQLVNRDGGGACASLQFPIVEEV